LGARNWVGEALEPSLLMSFLLVTLGTAVAAHDGSFNPPVYILTIIGVTLAQNAVNVLNDYHDYRTGVDGRTIKTPFSGGSKYLVTGLIKPEAAFSFGLVSFLLAASVGVYLIWTRGLTLLPLVLLGGISLYFYSTSFARIYFGEFLAGLNLGPLVVIGAYFVQAARFGYGSIAVGVAPGIMIANVLFLNEFPDVEADASAGRKNLPILLGRKRAAKLYVALESTALAWIAVSALTGLTPLTTIVALGSLPLAVKAMSRALRYSENSQRLVPGLGANILTAYLTMALLSVGYLISIALRI
jgi:1,4-dihydroxy-2-naphthoate octaprenyltransferase